MLGMLLADSGLSLGCNREINCLWLPLVAASKNDCFAAMD
jgi:hypothetical protein